MHAPHTHRDVYLCEGTCRAVVSTEEFTAGAKTCSTEGCSRKGQPYSAGEHCDHCGRTMTKAQSDRHHGKPE